MFYKSQHCWSSQFLEPIPGPLVKEHINLCEKTAWPPTINKHWMFELCWPCLVRSDAKWPHPSFVINGDSFAIRPISSMKYISGVQLFEKLLMKYSEACEKKKDIYILNSLSSTWIFVSHFLPRFKIWNVDLQLLTLRLLMSYIYGAPSKARNATVVYTWTYVWQRWNSLFLFAAKCFNTESMQRGFLCHICV